MSMHEFDPNLMLSDEQNLIFTLEALLAYSALQYSDQFAKVDLIGSKELVPDERDYGRFLRIERSLAPEDPQECFYNLSIHKPNEQNKSQFKIVDEHVYRTDGGYIYELDNPSDHTSIPAFNAGDYSIVVGSKLKELTEYLDEHMWVRRNLSRRQVFYEKMKHLGMVTLISFKHVPHM